MSIEVKETIISDVQPISHMVLWLNTNDNKLYHWEEYRWRPLDSSTATYSKDVLNTKESKVNEDGIADITFKDGGVYYIKPTKKNVTTTTNDTTTTTEQTVKLKEILLDLDLKNPQSEVTVILYGDDIDSNFSFSMPSSIDAILGVAESDIQSKIKESFKTEINFRYNSAVFGFFEKISSSSQTDVTALQ